MDSSIWKTAGRVYLHAHVDGYAGEYQKCLTNLPWEVGYAAVHITQPLEENDEYFDLHPLDKTTQWLRIPPGHIGLRDLSGGAKLIRRKV